MASNLSPENEQYIQNAIAAGRYHDRGEVLDKAVELLKRQAHENVPTALASEKLLARDWLRPEEDEAWRDL